MGLMLTRGPCRVLLIASILIAMRTVVTGGGSPSFSFVFAGKGGVGCFLRETPHISLILMVLRVGYQAFFVRFCALLLRISAFRWPPAIP
jgi:hypothetical protein